MLIKPDDFQNDTYGFMTNQISHWAIGLVSAYALTSFGLSPLATSLCLFAVYFFLIELFMQGWRGLDTLEDTFAFMAGALTITLASTFIEKQLAFLFFATWLLFGAVRRVE